MTARRDEQVIAALEAQLSADRLVPEPRDEPAPGEVLPSGDGSWLPFLAACAVVLLLLLALPISYVLS